MLKIVVLTAITASIIGLAELFFGMSPVYAASGSPMPANPTPVIGWIIAS